MSKDIKKALEHCIEWNCVDCPNREELGSGETVCRGRLLTDVLEYVSDIEAKLAESEKSNDEWVKICDGKLETINRLIEEKHELEETIKNKSHNKWLKAEAEKYKNEYQSLKGYVDQLKQQLADMTKKYELASLPMVEF